MKKGCGYVEVDDIFEALGLEDAAELRAQTLLGVEVCKRIRAMKATQRVCFDSISPLLAICVR